MPDLLLRRDKGVKLTQDELDDNFLAVMQSAVGKNIITGGDFHQNQWGNGTSFSTPSDQDPLANNWKYVNATGTAVNPITKETDGPAVADAEVVSQYSLKAAVSTTETVVAGTLVAIAQDVSGFDWTRVAQQQFTLSFWVKASKTGTYCVAFRNTGKDRSYIAEYTVTLANTWEYKTITVAASPSAGTWDYENGVGVEVLFVLAAGATFQGAAGSWLSGNYAATINQVNACDNTANTFQLDLVQLERGTTATPFGSREYILEKLLQEAGGGYNPGAAYAFEAGTATSVGVLSDKTITLSTPFTVIYSMLCSYVDNTTAGNACTIRRVGAGPYTQVKVRNNTASTQDISWMVIGSTV